MLNKFGNVMQGVRFIPTSIQASAPISASDASSARSTEALSAMQYAPARATANTTTTTTTTTTATATATATTIATATATAPPPAESVDVIAGRLLVAGRTKAGLTRENVARTLALSVKQVCQLEEGTAQSFHHVNHALMCARRYRLLVGIATAASTDAPRQNIAADTLDGVYTNRPAPILLGLLAAFPKLLAASFSFGRVRR